MPRNSPSQAPGNDDDSIKLILGVIVIFFIFMFMVQHFYASNRTFFNTIFLFANSVFLHPISLVFGKAGSMIEQMKDFDVARLEWMHIKRITDEVGRVVRWPIIFFCGFLIFLNIKIGKSIERYKRNFNINSLLENNIKNFPCIAPVVGRNILDDDPDKGSWKTARTPLQFAAENGLLISRETKKPLPEKMVLKKGMANMQSSLLEDNSDVMLDEEKARKVFTKQLGPIFNGPENLPYHQRGIAAALMAFGCGDKKTAQDLFDHMSLSFKEAGGGSFSWKIWGKNRGELEDHFVDIKNADDIIEQYKDDEDFLYATRHHNLYTYTWFHSLLEFARAKGVVSTAQFIWLRPMDRPLFYVLNQVGGRTSFAEAAGAWAHYYAEYVLKQAIGEPEINEAVVALKGSLMETGWIREEGQARVEPDDDDDDDDDVSPVRKRLWSKERGR